MRDRLAELQIDKVAVRKDIPTNQLGGDEIAGDMGAQLRRELGGILDRWGSGRTEEADQKKRPLLGSDEWRVIVAGYDATRRSNRLDTQTQRWETAKWQNWRAESVEELWGWLGALNQFHRRRPVLGRTDELWGVKKRGDTGLR